MDFTEFLNNMEKFTDIPSVNTHLHPTENNTNGEKQVDLNPASNTYIASPVTAVMKNIPSDQYVELDETGNASKNNGMLTKVWGPPLWIGLHAITFGYPEKIDITNKEHLEKRKAYYEFFKLVGDVLPCKYCRQSYKEYFTDLDPMPFLNNRRDIVRWLFTIHNKVNDKLKVPECDRISFLDFTTQYETYRAKCKPDNREEELVKQANAEKGCIKPLDNTPKRAVINVVKCEKGDVTRRDNMFEGWMNTGAKNDYILIKKKWFVLVVLVFFGLLTTIVLLKLNY